ncbi:MAG: class I SAM-dependent methyltransferase [Calditrichia bacterium]
MTKQVSPQARVREKLKSIKTTAAFTPSSPFVANRICKYIDFKSSEVLIEYGAGNGAITKYILKKMRSDARLILIEINPELVAELRHEITDPRVSIIQGSAVDAPKLLANNGVLKVDSIICSIPFFWLKPAERNKVVADSHTLLKPNSSFFTLQMFWLPRSNQLAYLERHFTMILSETEYRNIPPLQMFRSIKK